MIAVAVVCAGLATLLLVPGRRSRPVGLRRTSVAGRLLLLGGGVAGGVLLLEISIEVAVLAGLAGAAVVASAVLWRGRRARRAAAQTARRVLEVCEVLAAELAAGQPPSRALDQAVETWPPLGPAAEALRVGADLPTSLRELAALPGAGDLRLVAAAWQVAHRTGQGLAAAMGRVAAGVRAAEESRRIVHGELASARTTARLVGALPILSLTMGAGAGGDPWGFLLGHPLGLACLAGGLVFGFIGLWWIEAIAAEIDGAT